MNTEDPGFFISKYAACSKWSSIAGRCLFGTKFLLQTNKKKACIYTHQVISLSHLVLNFLLQTKNMHIYIQVISQDKAEYYPVHKNLLVLFT